jgi:hypothetical protein
MAISEKTFPQNLATLEHFFGKSLLSHFFLLLPSDLNLLIEKLWGKKRLIIT